MIRRILCLLGWHSKITIRSKTGGNLMKGWYCEGCPKRREPLEWPAPIRKG